ncbi:hypothetical protein ACSTJW_00145, partial [Vibrio parahaemolyticus]
VRVVATLSLVSAVDPALVAGYGTGVRLAHLLVCPAGMAVLATECIGLAAERPFSPARGWGRSLMMPISFSPEQSATWTFDDVGTVCSGGYS